MTFKDILSVAMAVAPVIPVVAAATTAQSTEVDILFPALDGMNINSLEGSVVGADTASTTIQIDCRSSATSQCLSSGYILPQTLTAGPSFQDLHYDITSLYNSTIYIVTGNLDCNVTGSTLGASCYFSTSTWISSGLNATSSAWATAVSISSFNLKYNTLTVLSGLENLPTETAATSASPGHTGTSTSAPTTTVATTPEHHSSSEVWIAGPVIGAVAGLALLAAAVFWCASRRRKANADPMYRNPAEGTPEDSEHQAEELPTTSPLVELPAQYKPHEMS
ncbi:hypothetical protein N7513_009615 [Penicillium frequentans]|nr:hypothetical protein N7513_009615 [Penicillium glabrum]